jgi:hypothetical protein
MIDTALQTKDGKFRIDLWANHTAELRTAQGELVHRTILFKIGRELANRGYSSEDLIPVGGTK